MYILSLLLIISIISCKTIGDVKREKDEGIVNIYPVPLDQAWKIALTVFHWQGADSVEEHREEGYMLSNSEFDSNKAGTLVKAWIEPVDENNTKVTIVTKEKLSTNMLTRLAELTFHKRFAQAVNIIKAGNPLPTISPD